MLAELPNTFEELNRVRCFNHTLQLSAKALLKPFYSSAGSSEDDNEPNDDMLVLRTTYDEEEPAEEENEDEDELEMDDEDEAEDEEPFSALDENDRVDLIENTEAVRMTLMKVCIYPFPLFCAHFHCNDRFVNSPSPSSIQPPLRFLHGAKPVLPILFMYDLSLVM